MLKELKKCMGGSHKWVKVYEKNTLSPGTSEVVRWCNICGSVVVDIDFDGRTNPGQIMKLKSPEIAKILKRRHKK